MCPECQSEISQYAETCPKCGFPIQKYMEENNLNDFEHVKICPVCGNTNGSTVPDILPTVFKCKKCGHAVVQTDIPRKGFHKLYTLENERDFMASIANKYGNNQFSYEMYDKWVRELHIKSNSTTTQSHQQKPVPKCPTCGSTDLRKITATEKATSSVLFGLFGNKRKKQFHCNSCGYEW